jgi:peptidoglycan/LPS O-acetylase OafA/YrhL
MATAPVLRPARGGVVTAPKRPCARVHPLYGYADLGGGMRGHSVAVKRRFVAIEGLRGLAAISVIGVHAATLFGPLLPAHGYLAVDFFFILSGIVMAASYDARFADGTLDLRRFTAMRLIRLMPTIAAATLIAALLSVAILVTGRGGGVIPFESVGAIAVSAGLTLFLVPQPWVDGRNYYPLNGPFWSLAFELLVNIAFAAFWRWLHGLRLLAVLLALAAGVVLLIPVEGSFDQGFAIEHAALAACRAGFGFFAGVALARLESRLPIRSTAAVWVAAGALVLVFWAPVGQFGFDAAVVLLLFPALAWAAMRFEPGPRTGMVALFLGKASYPVYALHMPLLLVTLAGLQLIGARDLAPSAGVALAFVIGVTVLGYAFDRLFDTPVRQWLTARWLRPASARDAAPAPHFSGDIGASSL